MKISAVLTSKEKAILKELFDTYKKNVNLFLDLANVLTDWTPKELDKVVRHLQERKLVQYLPSEDSVHCLCRITPLGLESLRVAHLSKQVLFDPKYLALAGILLFFGLSLSTFNAYKNPSKSFADVTGIGLNESTTAILTEWIENQEQENSDYYTFDLLEDWGDRKTYFVECKMEHLRNCKYNIVFVEVDEESGEITNVELAYD